MASPVSTPPVERMIYLIRGHRVMIDAELARIYGVTTKRLNEQVRRNRDRFPEDFMFQLTMDEAAALLASRSQNATLNRGQNVKYRPYAFTEHGAVMLASVLNSPTAVQASIQVVRAFIRLREMLAAHRALSGKLEALERRIKGHDISIRRIFQALKELSEPPPLPPRPKIGFRQ